MYHGCWKGGASDVRDVGREADWDDLQVQFGTWFRVRKLFHKVNNMRASSPSPYMYHLGAPALVFMLLTLFATTSIFRVQESTFESSGTRLQNPVGASGIPEDGYPKGVPQ